MRGDPLTLFITLFIFFFVWCRWVVYTSLTTMHTDFNWSTGNSLPTIVDTRLLHAVSTKFCHQCAHMRALRVGLSGGFYWINEKARYNWFISCYFLGYDNERINKNTSAVFWSVSIVVNLVWACVLVFTSPTPSLCIIW